jgi:hypothetical protein
MTGQARAPSGLPVNPPLFKNIRRGGGTSPRSPCGSYAYGGLLELSWISPCSQQSWNIGIDEDAQTVANFLKFYNPSPIVGSIGALALKEVSQKHKLQILSINDPM